MTTLKQAQKDPAKMQEFLKEHENDLPCDADKFDKLICVDTKVANTTDDLEKYHTYYTNQSYEGIMIRTMGGVYKQQGRSKDLQKYKKFHDDEFIVIGYHEGTGAHAGTPIFDCKSKVYFQRDKQNCLPLSLYCL